MNKWQIICPVVAMAFVAAFVLVGQGRRHRRYYVYAQTRMIGQELTGTTNSPRLVRIGPHLRDRLSSFLAVQGGVAEVLLGDEPEPLGDGTACSRLVLSNAAGARLGLRLRQDSKPERFHVAGFRTITEPVGASNPSRPFRLETNRASTAAGSRR